MIKVGEFMLSCSDAHNYIVYKQCTRTKRSDGSTYVSTDEGSVGYHSHWAPAIRDLISRLTSKKIKEVESVKGY